MARVRSLSSRAIDRLNVEKDTVFWDRELAGFGVRVYASGGKVYVAQARGPDGAEAGDGGSARGHRRRAGAAPDGPYNRPHQGGRGAGARAVGAKLANGPTVADLAARFMEDHVAVRCKPKTERTFRSLLDRHVLPALGKVRVGAVGREQAMEFHEGLAGLPTTANMAVKMLSHMFVMAENWGLVPEGTNPWRFVAKYPAGRRERYLTDVEFERLGRFLDEAERGGGGVALVNADGLPQGGDSHAEVGGHRPGGGGAEACRREDGRTDGVACTRGGAGSRRHSPRFGCSLGDYGQAAGDAYAKARRCVAAA